MFLEAVIKFWDEDIDEDGKDIRKKQQIHVLCQCVNYTEAEALATEYGLELTSESFDIGPITEMKVEQIYYDEDNNDIYPWFKCNCVYSIINDKGRSKDYKRNILVQAKDSAVASTRSIEIMKKWLGDDKVKTPKVSETQIQEILETEIEEEEEE